MNECDNPNRVAAHTSKCSPVAGPDAATVERCSFKMDPIDALDEFGAGVPLEGMPPRFTIEHGVIHDNKTGRHVRTCDCVKNDGGILDAMRLLNQLNSAASPITDTAGRNEIQRWRNDAFEASAGIVESYFGKDGEYCAADIRALKQSVLTDTDRMAKMEDAQSRVECSRCGAYDATGAFIKHCDERACPMRRDYDVCYCGDYRRDHLNGTGACRLNGLGHGLGAATAGECTEFRLASIAAIEAATEGENTKSRP